MAMNPYQERGLPLERQVRSWKNVALPPFRKQEVDAFTRCRVVLMNGIEVEASVFSHSFARACDDRALKGRLAALRRIEHQQQNTINWLNPADQTVLETTIAYEQVAIELTAYLARSEPDPRAHPPSPASHRRTSSCKRPFVATKVPLSMDRRPVRSVARPPASSTMRKGAAASQLFRSTSTIASAAPSATSV